MNLHALRLFHVIATTGSVTCAAELLNISQPAITAQIKKFEKELSLTLFKPQGRGIGLTAARAELVPLAKRLFSVEQQIEQFCLDYRSGSRGQICMAATYLPSHFLLPAWLAKYKQRYEEVEMSITTTNSSDALKQLLHMNVDLAIYGGLPEESPNTIQIEELFRMSYGLSYPRSPLCQSAHLPGRDDERAFCYAGGRQFNAGTFICLMPYP